MPNLYATLGAFKAEIGKTTTGDDAVLLRALERASREADAIAGSQGIVKRHFYSELATRTFDGDGTARIAIDDLVSVDTSLKVDQDGDGTYETTLAATTDYWLMPDNPVANTPYTHVELNPYSSVLTRFLCARKLVQIIGRFGYSNETEASGTLGAAIANGTDTAVTMTAGHGLTGGETIVIQTEHLYVSAVATDALTVVRGVNGTTAAAHNNGTAVTRRRFPRLVEEAVIVRAADIWRGTQTGYGQVATDEIGGFQPNPAYAQFKGLLALVSRHPVVVY